MGEGGRGVVKDWASFAVFGVGDDFLDFLDFDDGVGVAVSISVCFRFLAGDSGAVT